MNVNPWISILLNPRKTIREIIEYNPDYRIWVISFIYGLYGVFSYSQAFLVGYYLPVWAIVLIALILAPVFGYVNFSINAVLIFLVGKLLKGEAKYKEVRASIMWSSYFPIVVIMIAWGSLIFLSESNPFKYRLESVGLGALPLLIASFFIIVTCIWALVIYVKCLSEVEKFSVFKAVLTILLTVAFVAIAFFLFFLFLGWFCSHFCQMQVPMPNNLTFLSWPF